MTDAFALGQILEIGEGLSGAFAGLILAGLGFEVVQVRDGLDRRLDERESAFYDRYRVLGGGEVGTVMAELLPEVDVLLTDLSPARMRSLGLPLDEQQLSAVRPGLAAVAVTPFGLTGPRADFATSDITEWAAGGLSYMTRRGVPHDDDEHYTPVLPPGRQPEVLAGIAAAVATLVSLRLARERHRSVLADVSRQEVLTSMAHAYFPHLLHTLVVHGARDYRVDWGWLLPAADGEIYMRTVEVSQWDRLVEWMGAPDWAVTGPGQEPLYRTAPDVVGTLVGEWTRQHTKAWLLEEAARRRVPVAPSRVVSEVLEWSHLQERGVWETIPTPAGDEVGPRLPLVGRRPTTPPCSTSDEATSL